MIGDRDPEDAYDAGDPDDARLDVLEAVVVSITATRPVDRVRSERRRRDALRVVEVLLRRRRPPARAVAVAAALEALADDG